MVETRSTYRSSTAVWDVESPKHSTKHVDLPLLAFRGRARYVPGSTRVMSVGAFYMVLMSYLVYLIRCSVSGKPYVGYTGKSLKQRWRAHCDRARQGSTFPLHRAIRHHDPDAFTCDVLQEFDTKEGALTGEAQWIKSLNAFTAGYNATPGGDCGPVMIGEDNPLVRIGDQTAYQIIEAARLYEIDVREIAEVYEADASAMYDWVQGRRRAYLLERFQERHPRYADGWSKVDDLRLEALTRALTTTESRTSVAESFGFGPWTFYEMCRGEVHAHIRKRFDALYPSYKDNPYNMRGGDGNPSAKLTEHDVREIRKRYTGEWGQASALAREYGVSDYAIHSIVRYRTWQHVE